MDLLDHGRVVAGRDQEMVACDTHARPFDAGKADGDEAVLVGDPQRRQNVRGTSRGRQREQQVAATAEACDLAGKDLFEPVIVGDRRQRRGIGGQRDRGISRPILLVAADDFGRYVLGVRRAAAIAGDQNFMAGTQAADHDVGDLARGR